MGAGLRLAQVERSSTVEIAPYTGRSIVPSPKNNPILGRGIASSPTKESLHKSWLRQKHEKVKLSSRPRAGRAQPDGKKRILRLRLDGAQPRHHTGLGRISIMQKYNYRRTLPHIQKDNRPLFVTFSTYKRWVLPESARQLVLECCIQEHAHIIELHAALVMPDHAHLIFTPLISPAQETYSLPDIMRLIKGRAARKINLLLGRRGPVWQEECFDHVLRSNESLAEKIEYICQNPVRAGLVECKNDYPCLWRGRIPVL